MNATQSKRMSHRAANQRGLYLPALETFADRALAVACDGRLADLALVLEWPPSTHHLAQVRDEEVVRQTAHPAGRYLRLLPADGACNRARIQHVATVE